jgi:hypothetical protein
MILFISRWARILIITVVSKHLNSEIFPNLSFPTIIERSSAFGGVFIYAECGETSAYGINHLISWWVAVTNTDFKSIHIFSRKYTLKLIAMWLHGMDNRDYQLRFLLFWLALSWKYPSIKIWQEPIFHIQKKSKLKLNVMWKGCVIHTCIFRENFTPIDILSKFSFCGNF